MRSSGSMWKLLALVAFTGLGAATLSGCHLHGVSAGFSYHDSYPHTYSDAHVHASGCGHYYWHDSWYGYPHPYDCDWGCGGGAVVVEVHRHHGGCGHYYWHGGWYGYPHPYDCHSCGGGHRHGGGGYYKAPRADYDDQAEAAYARQQAAAKRQAEQGRYLQERQQAAARQQYERQQAAASQQYRQQQAGAKQQRDQAKWLYERMKKGQAPPP